MARRKPPLNPQGWLNGRDAAWAAIRALGQDDAPFTLTDVMRRGKVSEHLVRDYLPQLVDGGFLSAQKVPGHAVLYRLVRDWGVDTPRFDGDGALVTEPTARERLWQAMKVLPSFNAAELAAMAQATLSHTKSYVLDLKRAGYLEVVADGQGRLSRYHLPSWRNTGGKPPAVRRDKSIFDLNLGRQVWPEGAE
jgi:hypothetical protein